jgi:hypothetical protein
MRGSWFFLLLVGIVFLGSLTSARVALALASCNKDCMVMESFKYQSGDFFNRVYQKFDKTGRTKSCVPNNVVLVTASFPYSECKDYLDEDGNKIRIRWLECGNGCDEACDKMLYPQESNCPQQITCVEVSGTFYFQTCIAK